MSKVKFQDLPYGVREIIKFTIVLEDGYVNNPDDSGAATRWGVTEETARANGYEGDMKDLPKEFAYELSANEFWVENRLTEVTKMSIRIAGEIFDTSYNCGCGSAWKMVQRGLNAMNRKAADWPDIKVDGVAGPNTLKCLEAALRVRGEAHVYKVLNVIQGAFYLSLVERRQKDETFFNGWIDHRISF